MLRTNQSAQGEAEAQFGNAGTISDVTTTTPGFELRVVRDFEDLESLRPSWERFQAHPNTDIDFYKLIMKSRPEILRPHVVQVSENGVPIGLVVGRIERSAYHVRLGYKQLVSPELKKLIIPFGGIMGKFSPQSIRRVTAELFSEIRRNEAELILFSHLRTDTAAFQTVAVTGPWYCREAAHHRQLHWRFTLPRTVDEFLAEHYWPRRLPRRLEKKHPGKVRFVAFQSSDEIDKLCKDSELIAAKTYQRGLGAGFFDHSEMRERLNLAAEKGWLCGFILYVEEVPWAFWIGTLYQGVFHSDFTGYDPAFSKDEPGTTVFSLMVQHLIRNGITTMDFGLGDSFYKKRFGNESWEESSVTIFAPTVKGCLLNAAATCSVAFSNATRKLLENTQLVSKVKTIWRRRIRVAAVQEASIPPESAEQKETKQG